MGHAAVSTIEAIAYAAVSARAKQLAPHTPDDRRPDDASFTRDLLLLFRLQKYRVLDNIVNHGTKAPRAMVVHGELEASWRGVSVIDGSASASVASIGDMEGFVYSNL